MNLIHAVILGIIEGVTEFLPISSTGHLILASKLLQLQDTEFVKSFEIAIQLGAILSVIFLYARQVLSSLDLMKKVVVAFIPTGVIGILAYPYVKGYLLGNEQVVILALFFGGAALFAFEKFFPGYQGKTDLSSMTYKQAVGIGLAQSVAVVPGVSRAAATILGGLFAGMDRKSIVEFSFLLAIPTMAAATGLDLIKSGSSFTSQEWAVLSAGFIVSFATALLAVKWLLKYVQTHDFKSFGIYRVVLAFLFWLYLMR